MTQASNGSFRRVIGSIGMDGKLHKGVIDPNLHDTREHPLHRQYVRERMREDYSRDIVQPYAHGQANGEYAEAFGREAALEQFGKSETRKAMEQREQA